MMMKRLLFSLLVLLISALTGPVQLRAESIGADGVAEYDGVVVAAREAAITPLVEGWLNTIEFVPGEFVEEGQILFRFNTIPQQHRIAITEAKIATAKAQLALADVELQRVSLLERRDVVATAKLQEAQAKHEIAKQAIIQLEQTLALDKIVLKHLTRRAPISGIISAPRVQVNGYHAPKYNDDILLATITQLDPIQVRGEAPYEIFAERRSILKTDAATVSGLEVQLVLPDGTIYPHNGKYVSGGYEFDVKTQKLSVWAEFPNPDHFLRPGLKLRVRTRLKE